MTEQHTSSKSNSNNENPLKKFSQSNFFKEFSEFINRGNVVELAIGVAVGGAFTAIVTSLVNDIIMPITSLLAGGADFTKLAIDVPNIFGADTTAHIAYGNFIQNVVNFLIVAFTIFIIVRALNRLNRREDARKEKEAKAQKAKDNRDTKAQIEKIIKASASAPKPPKKTS